jgi:hypothetical protein
LISLTISRKTGVGVANFVTREQAYEEELKLLIRITGGHVAISDHPLHSSLYNV